MKSKTFLCSDEADVFLTSRGYSEFSSTDRNALVSGKVSQAFILVSMSSPYQCFFAYSSITKVPLTTLLPRNPLTNSTDISI